MLAAHYRLCAHKHITQAQRRGRRFCGAHGVCFLFFSTKKQDTPKITVILSKKFSPLAVRRNRQRRILLAAFRQVITEVPLGMHIILSCQKGVKMVSYKDAVADCKQFIATQ